MATPQRSVPPAPIFQFEVRTQAEGPPSRFVSPLAPEQVNQRTGLRAEAIIGRAKDPAKPVDPENFVHNEDFLRFLHGVIARHAPLCPGFMLEAERIKTGIIYVLDGRNPSSGGKPAEEDILGVVTVSKGRVTEYKAFSSYRAYTRQGFMLIDPWLHTMLVNELLALPVAAHEVRDAAPG